MRIGFLWSGIDNKKERREGVVRKRLMSLGRLLSNFSKESQRARVGIYKRERWGYRVKFEMELPGKRIFACLLYTSPSPRDRTRSRMPSSA